MPVRPAFATPPDAPTRVRELVVARDRGLELLALVEQQGLLRPGVTESALSAEIHALARARLGVTRHWHKRIVRAGPNTLLPFQYNPLDRALAENDIAYLDLGPVFGAWEADIGRTYVLGHDPEMLRLQADLPLLFDQGRARHAADPAITGAALYASLVADAEARGWRFAGKIGGHLVGEFPHAHVPAEKIAGAIAPGNHVPMDTPDAYGRPRHWILEIHLAHPSLPFGGFHEDLLTL